MKVRVTQLDGVNTMNALPLAAGQVVAAAKADPLLAERFEFEIVVGNASPARLVEEMGETDVLGLSVYLWNAQLSLEVARQTRRAHPACLIVAGGPAVPTRAEAAERFLRAHRDLDVLVLGEGEATFRELLRAHATGGALGDVAGLAFLDAGDRLCLTAPRPRLSDFSSTPSPYLDGTFDELLDRYPDRYPNSQACALFETNRGCPFTCTFCSSGLAVHNRVYELPVERARAELDWIVARGFPYLFVVDLNFGIRPRDGELAEYLAELKRRTGYPGYCFFYLTKNARERHLAPVETLLGAGIATQVALSTQSFDDDVLSAVRRANIPAARWLGLRERFNQRGIRTYNELILGLPAQTRSSFAQTIVRALSTLARDTFYLYLCRVIPNSEMEQPEYRARHGIATRRCRAVPADPRFEAPVDEYEDIVVATATLPLEEWRRAYAFGYLVSACYNQRLLDVVVHYLMAALKADMASYFGHLCEAVERAAIGTAFAELRAVFERYLASILAGGPVLLPVRGAGAANREVSDALVAVALRRRSDFFDEAEAATAAFLEGEGASTEQIAELFRFQRFVTPRFGEREERSEGFDHDWLTYWRQGGADRQPQRVACDVYFQPPGYTAAPSFEGFIDHHLAALRARLDTGVLWSSTSVTSRSITGSPTASE